MKIIIALMTVLLVPSLALALNTNSDFYTVPANITMNANYSVNTTVNFSLFNNWTDSVFDIKMNSTYLVNFTPYTPNIPTGELMNYTGIFNIVVENFTSSTVNDTIYIYGNDSNGTQALLATLPIYFNMTNANPYYFKKCFLENNQEFCAAFNISDVQIVNLTIINQTVDNSSYNVLIPLNATREYFDNYNSSLTNVLTTIVAQFKNASDNINNASQQIILAQQKQNQTYANMFALDNFLKNPANPLWVEISPSNSLMNMTGMTDQQFMDAMALMFQNSKLTQRTDNVTLSIPVQNGAMTQVITKTYIASSDRIRTEADQQQSSTTVNIAIFITLMAMAGIGFYEIYWKKRVVL